MNNHLLSSLRLKRRPIQRRPIQRRLVATSISLASLVGLLVSPVSAAINHPNQAQQSVKVCHAANGLRVTNVDVCRGLAFYKGKTMTFIDIGSIGGPFDAPGIAITPFLQQYLGVTVNISPFPSGNSIPGQDFLAHATPDGLTFGMLNPLNDVSDILLNTPGINFNPERLAYLVQSGVNASPLIAAQNSGYTNFSQVVSASKNGTLTMLTQNTGTLNTILRTWMGVLGVHPHYISGYAKLADEVTGLVRGDGPIGQFDLSLACPLLQSGKAVVLATTIVPPVGTNCRKYLTGVPTLKSLEKQYPPKTKKTKTEWSTLLALFSVTGNPMVTQTSVASFKINTLRAAIQWSFAQPSFKTTMFNFGQNPTYGNPVKAKQSYLTALTLGKSVICFVQGTC